MVLCAVLNCDTRSDAVKLYRRRQTHDFPVDPFMRNQWISACGRGDNFVPTTSHRVCCRHFKYADYVHHGTRGQPLKRKMLKPGSMPTECLPSPTPVVIHDHGHLHVPVVDQFENPAEEIQYLRTKLAGQEALNEQQSKEIGDLRSEKIEYEEAFRRIFNEDQIHRLRNPKSRGKFSADTMKRAVLLYYTCGSSGYRLLLQQGNELLVHSPFG